MTTRLDLIQFETLHGEPCTEYGLQEVDEYGHLVALYDQEADQLNHPNANWTFVRVLGDVDDTDDFWRLVEEAPEITPSL